MRKFKSRTKPHIYFHRGVWRAHVPLFSSLERAHAAYDYVETLNKKARNHG